jgi:hypothetical protein
MATVNMKQNSKAHIMGNLKMEFMMGRVNLSGAKIIIMKDNIKMDLEMGLVNLRKDKNSMMDFG